MDALNISKEALFTGGPRVSRARFDAGGNYTRRRTPLAEERAKIRRN